MGRGRREKRAKKGKEREKNELLQYACTCTWGSIQCLVLQYVYMMERSYQSIPNGVLTAHTE